MSGWVLFVMMCVCSWLMVVVSCVLCMVGCVSLMLLRFFFVVMFVISVGVRYSIC